MMYIGTASDSKALPLFSRHLFIAGKESLDKVGILRNMVWRNHSLRLKDKALSLHGFSRHVFTIFLCSANGNTAVVDKVHFLLGNLEDIQGTGKLSAFLILQLCSDSGTVRDTIREEF